MILISNYSGGGDIEELEFIPVNSVGAVSQAATSKQVWVLENLIQSQLVFVCLFVFKYIRRCKNKNKWEI